MRTEEVERAIGRFIYIKDFAKKTGINYVLETEDLKNIITLLNYIFKLEDDIYSKFSQEQVLIDEIQKEVRGHIAFENRLKRDNEEPDLFNQGRFYVANEIKDILNRKKVENEK